MKRSPLRRKTPLKRKTRMATVSLKRRKALQAYGRQRKSYLANHPNCEACASFGGAQPPAVEIHHTAGRTGSNYLDARTWLAVCSPCHRAIHNSPNTARSMGLLK